MALTLDISFGWSASPFHAQAVAQAKAFSSYYANGDCHRIREAVTKKLWPQLNALLILTNGWKTTEVLVNGSTDRIFHQVAELRRVFECHGQRSSTNGGDRHCLGQEGTATDPRFFGCRFARGARLIAYPGYHISAPPADWWKFGHLDDAVEAFWIDKPAILRAVESESNAAPCSVCPSFSTDRIAAVVKALPDSIDVGLKWGLRFSKIDPSKAIGVEPKDPEYL